MSTPTRPVKPRHSASLLLIDRTGPAPRVLMGRRPVKSRFVPDVFVFPGGGVESHDGTLPPVSPLAQPVAAHLARQPGPAARVLADAAIRETIEETGLAVGEAAGETITRPNHGALAFLGRAITPTDSAIRFHARFFMADAAHASGTPRSNGELLDMAWVTFTEAAKLPLIDVTEMMLERAEQVLAQPQWHMQPILFSYRGGKPTHRPDGESYTFRP